MTRFTVDLDELDRVVGSMDAFLTTFAGRRARLQKTVDELQGDWLGEAAQAQAVAHREIAKGVRELEQALKDLHAAAQKAHASYLAAVRANQATWRQVR